MESDSEDEPLCFDANLAVAAVSTDDSTNSQPQDTLGEGRQSAELPGADDSGNKDLFSAETQAVHLLSSDNDDTDDEMFNQQTQAVEPPGADNSEYRDLFAADTQVVHRLLSDSDETDDEMFNQQTQVATISSSDEESGDKSHTTVQGQVKVTHVIASDSDETDEEIFNQQTQVIHVNSSDEESEHVTPAEESPATSRNTSATSRTAEGYVKVMHVTVSDSDETDDEMFNMQTQAAPLDDGCKASTTVATTVSTQADANVPQALTDGGESSDVESVDDVFNIGSRSTNQRSSSANTSLNLTGSYHDASADTVLLEKSAESTPPRRKSRPTLLLMRDSPDLMATSISRMSAGKVTSSPNLVDESLEQSHAEGMPGSPDIFNMSTQAVEVAVPSSDSEQDDEVVAPETPNVSGVETKSAGNRGVNGQGEGEVSDSDELFVAQTQPAFEDVCEDVAATVAPDEPGMKETHADVGADDVTCHIPGDERGDSSATTLTTDKVNEDPLVEPVVGLNKNKRGRPRKSAANKEQSENGSNCLQEKLLEVGKGKRSKRGRKVSFAPDLSQQDCSEQPIGQQMLLKPQSPTPSGGERGDSSATTLKTDKVNEDPLVEPVVAAEVNGELSLLLNKNKRGRPRKSAANKEQSENGSSCLNLVEVGKDKRSKRGRKVSFAPDLSQQDCSEQPIGQQTLLKPSQSPTPSGDERGDSSATTLTTDKVNEDPLVEPVVAAEVNGEPSVVGLNKNKRGRPRKSAANKQQSENGSNCLKLVEVGKDKRSERGRKVSFAPDLSQQDCSEQPTGQQPLLKPSQSPTPSDSKSGRVEELEVQSACCASPLSTITHPVSGSSALSTTDSTPSPSAAQHSLAENTDSTPAPSTESGSKSFTDTENSGQATDCAPAPSTTTHPVSASTSPEITSTDSTLSPPAAKPGKSSKPEVVSESHAAPELIESSSLRTDKRKRGKEQVVEVTDSTRPSPPSNKTQKVKDAEPTCKSLPVPIKGSRSQRVNKRKTANKSPDSMQIASSTPDLTTQPSPAENTDSTSALPVSASASPELTSTDSTLSSPPAKPGKSSKPEVVSESHAAPELIESSSLRTSKRKRGKEPEDAAVEVTDSTRPSPPLNKTMKVKDTEPMCKSLPAPTEGSRSQKVSKRKTAKKPSDSMELTSLTPDPTTQQSPAENTDSTSAPSTKSGHRAPKELTRKTANELRVSVVDISPSPHLSPPAESTRSVTTLTTTVSTATQTPTTEKSRRVRKTRSNNASLASDSVKVRSRRTKLLLNSTAQQMSLESESTSTQSTSPQSTSAQSTSTQSTDSRPVKKVKQSKKMETIIAPCTEVETNVGCNSELVENRRNLRTSTVKVTFTGLSDTQSLEKMAVQLGWTVTTDISKCTHLIADQVKRTIKFMCAVNRGLHIVTSKWIVDSHTKKKCLDVVKYSLLDSKAEKLHEFNLEASLSWARAHPEGVLSGHRVFVTKSTQPPPEEIKELVMSAGGKMCKMLPKEPEKNLYVVSCDQDKRLYHRLLGEGHTVVSKEFVLSTVLKQRLCVKEHRLQ